MNLFPQRTFAALALAAFTLAAHAAQTSNTTVKDDLFSGTEKFAKNASDVEEITMDNDTLARVSGNPARGMVLNVVHTYTYSKPGMYNIADVEEYRNKLNTGEWHCSVHISHPLKGESTDVCQRRRTDGMSESAIITVEPKQLTFIHKITRGANQSSIYSYGYGYSNAEAQAELAIQMAEMHANMAGMSAQIAASVAVGVAGIPYTGSYSYNGNSGWTSSSSSGSSSTTTTQQLQKQLNTLKPPAAPALAPANGR